MGSILSLPLECTLAIRLRYAGARKSAFVTGTAPILTTARAATSQFESPVGPSSSRFLISIRRINRKQVLKSILLPSKIECLI